MEVDEATSSSNQGPPSSSGSPGDVSLERFGHIRKILERPGPFCHELFEPSPDLLQMVQMCKVLIVGAGGLGCELVKDLAMMGFQNLHIIDMDTIDLSNLNRQFLFRLADVGRSKAEAAAEFINKRVQGVKVVPHYCKIEDKDTEFYRGFHIIVCGLDSVVARRWLNNMVFSLLEYDDDGGIDLGTVIPMVDGGTEGFKGNARVIYAGQTPCIECMLDLYPPQINYPLCTLATKPRLPEHCIEYVRLMQWGEEKPFDAPIDGDDPNHINWIYEKALERSAQFGIQGVTYRLTQGVVKHIIPAVASTNAIIAAACATEVLKYATACCKPMDNFMTFSDIEGIYTFTYKAEKKDDCIVCSGVPTLLTFSNQATLLQVITFLKEDEEYKMKNPTIIANIDGRNRTFFMSSMSATHGNLEKKLTDLGVGHRTEVVVSDSTTPKARTFIIQFEEVLAAAN